MAIDWRGFRQGIGMGVGQVGQLLGSKKDRGISEWIGGYGRARAAEQTPWDLAGMTEDQWRLENGLTTSTGQIDRGLALNNLGLQGSEEGGTTPLYGSEGGTEPAGGGEDDGGGTTYNPNMQYFNGQWYDMNNQEDVQRYLADYQNQAYSIRDMDLMRAQREQEANIRGIRNSLNQVDTTEGQTLRDLQEGYGLGTARRQAYYSGLSPNAFQSSQGSSQAYSLGKLNEGSAETARAAELNREELNSALNDYATAYNDYRAQREMQYNQDIDSALSNIGTNAQSRGWNYNSFAPSEKYSQAIDTAAYTPYTTFGQIASSPQAGATVGKVFGQQGFQPGSRSLNQYLNYSPNKKQYPALNQYLNY